MADVARDAIAATPSSSVLLTFISSCSKDRQRFATLGLEVPTTLDFFWRRMYVVGKDLVSRTVFVASGRNHPALFTASAQLRAPSWIAGRPPEGLAQVWEELRDSPVSI